jgi:DNA-binding IscR family transcriptional regulator
MTEICGFLASCRIKYLWAKVRDAVAHTIDTMTLAELVGSPNQEQEGANPAPIPSQFIAISDIRVAHSSTN